MRSKSLRWFLTVYSVALVGAGLNHAYDIWQGGWLPYRQSPMFMNAYWTALTVLDPVAAVLLWWRTKAGLVLLFSIMMTDVAINSYGRYWLEYGGCYGDVSLQLQTLFLGFVLGSFVIVWGQSTE